MAKQKDQQRAHPVWSPIAAVLALFAPAALAWATGQVFLFPSLGPTAVMQAHEPRNPGSRPYPVIISHAAGLAAGFLGAAVFGLAKAPSVFTAHQVSAARVGAALLALGVGTAVEIALRAQHPPAASTTLLAALGSFHPTWHDTVLVIGGVIAVTVSGELLRQVRTRFGFGDQPGYESADGNRIEPRIGRG